MSVIDENRTRTLVLVFTQGVGLRTWSDAGFASREIDYYRDIAKELGAVTFLTYDKSDPHHIADLPNLGPIEVQFNSISLDRRIFSLLAPLLKFRPLKDADVIKTTQHRGAWTALLLKWLLRKPMLARCGYIWSLFEKRAGASRSRSGIIKFLEGFVLRHADAISVPDEFAVNYLSELHGISKKKFTVIPNFVDTDLFVPGDLSSRSKNQFLFIGRLESDQKRPGLAVKGAALVPDAHLDIIGDGPEFAKFTSIIDSVDNVQLLGRLPHTKVSELMGEAVGLVIPSRYEGNPKVVIEAMSAGLPVIATRAQGLSNIVKHRVNGLIVEPNAESIADAMRSLLNDTDLWLNLSQNARKTAVDEYSRTSVLSRELTLLNQLIDG